MRNVVRCPTIHYEVNRVISFKESTVLEEDVANCRQWYVHLGAGYGRVIREGLIAEPTDVSETSWDRWCIKSKRRCQRDCLRKVGSKGCLFMGCHFVKCVSVRWCDEPFVIRGEPCIVLASHYGHLYWHLLVTADFDVREVSHGALLATVTEWPPGRRNHQGIMDTSRRGRQPAALEPKGRRYKAYIGVMHECLYHQQPKNGEGSLPV